MNRTKIILLATGLLVVVLAGIGGKLTIDRQRVKSSAVEEIGALENDEAAATAIAVQQSKITFPEALRIAEAAVDGQTYNIERETEKGKPVIEVGVNGQEVFVDAETGEIVQIDDLRQNGDREDIAEITKALELRQLATIPIQQALRTAENLAGGQAHTVDLENEDGSLVYEVVIELQEIYVDAGNGQVLFTETVGQADKSNRSYPKGSIQVPATED